MLDLIVPYLKRRVKGKAQRSVEGSRGSALGVAEFGAGDRDNGGIVWGES